MKSCALLLSVSALAFTWSSASIAQTSPAPPPAPANLPQATDTAAAPATDTATDTSQDIVVTALRRNDRLSQTPIAASVLSGNDLANKGVVNVDALQFAMPSVVVNNFGQGLEFNVRGIGKAEHNTQTTTGVITYRDGVPSFPGYFQQEPYFDIANVQVLRGPQGTVVGQNATGGAVFVNTNDPIIGGGTHGYFNANYGNYNDLGGQGAINIPISDNFAARVAFYGERRDGYYNITGPGGAPYTGNNGQVREIAGRVSFLWKPTDQLSILSKTDVDYLDLGGYPADPYTDRFKVLPGTNTPNPNYSDLFNIRANSPQGARDKFVRSVLKIDYAFDSGIKFRSVSGFSTGNTSYVADLDGTAATANVAATATTPALRNTTFSDTVTETQFSQEFNLLSPDNQRFTWLVGGFGLLNTYFYPQPYQFIIDTPAVGQPLGTVAGQYRLQGRNPNRAYAVFGQVGYKITPKLTLDLGGRYTTTKTTNYVDINQNGLLLRDQESSSSNNFSYKASLGWAVNANNYLYGFVATGFRPGGLNLPVGFGVNTPFGPEKVRSYEAGWKANFAGGHIHTTVDAFYNDYENFQVIVGYPDVPVFGIEINVPNTTKIYGFEASADFKFGGFSFDAGLNVLKSKLGQFYATDTRQPIALTNYVPCSPTAGPASTSCINLGGREQTYAPNLTFNVGAQYDLKLGNGDTITPRANFGHIAAQWATLFENPALGDRLGDRNILTAQLAWAHKTWTLTGYATNLTNQHYVAALQSGLDFAGPPRQYGVKVLKSF